MSEPWFVKWLDIGPLESFPLWAQAAVLSAGFAALVFVVPSVFRWIWHLGAGRPVDEWEDE